MQIKYLGHSAFEIEIDHKKILIDPFLIMCPNYDLQGITDIFITHGHSDHIGSAIEISKQTGAKITAIFELANYCSLKGASINGINLGSWISYDWGKVIAVPASHSSSTPDGTYAGEPCGYVFEIDGKKIYHAGDTSLNAEMKIIGELYSPEISLLPIGGYYTMGIEQATIASQWLNTKVVIPMHYNTFEVINVDLKIFESNIKKRGKYPCILNIGEIYSKL
ncbi:metal-dependent hydrolase [bacterium]|nr:metal-dependent hydrolase [bacterium]